MVGSSSIQRDEGDAEYSLKDKAVPPVVQSQHYITAFLHILTMKEHYCITIISQCDISLKIFQKCLFGGKLGLLLYYFLCCLYWIL